MYIWHKLFYCIVKLMFISLACLIGEWYTPAMLKFCDYFIVTWLNIKSIQGHERKTDETQISKKKQFIHLKHVAWRGKLKITIFLSFNLNQLVAFSSFNKCIKPYSWSKLCIIYFISPISIETAQRKTKYKIFSLSSANPTKTARWTNRHPLFKVWQVLS